MLEEQGMALCHLSVAAPSQPGGPRFPFLCGLLRCVFRRLFVISATSFRVSLRPSHLSTRPACADLRGAHAARLAAAGHDGGRED